MPYEDPRSARAASKLILALTAIADVRHMAGDYMLQYAGKGIITLVQQIYWQQMASWNDLQTFGNSKRNDIKKQTMDTYRCQLCSKVWIPKFTNRCKLY